MGPSLTFNAAVKYGVPQSGRREGRDDEHDCDTGLISLAKCVLSDPPAAAGQSYISARLGLALLGEEGEPRNGPF